MCMYVCMYVCMGTLWRRGVQRTSLQAINLDVVAFGRVALADYCGSIAACLRLCAFGGHGCDLLSRKALLGYQSPVLGIN